MGLNFSCWISWVFCLTLEIYFIFPHNHAHVIFSIFIITHWNRIGGKSILGAQRLVFSYIFLVMGLPSAHWLSHRYSGCLPKNQNQWNIVRIYLNTKQNPSIKNGITVIIKTNTKHFLFPGAKKYFTMMFYCFKKYGFFGDTL